MTASKIAFTGLFVFVAVTIIGLSPTNPRFAEAGTVAETTYRGRVGLNTRVVWVSESSARQQLQRAREGGIEWVRVDFPWRVVEPSRARYHWGQTDGLMAAASVAGVNVLGILGYSAPWASSDPSGRADVLYPPRDPSTYASYAAAVVKRYGAGGDFWSSRPELEPRPLAAVELWNEAFGHWAWKPNPDPPAYARLALAAASAIRSISPTVKILIAGDLDQVRADKRTARWIEDVMAAEPQLKLYVDAYSVHPYPSPRNLGPYDDRPDQAYRWDYRRTLQTHEVVTRLGAGRPIWITEIGWSTASGVTDGVTEPQQAAFTEGAVRRALVEWGAVVERVFVYQWDQSSGVPGDREGNYGLRRPDDSAKPAWNMLVHLLGEEASSGSVSVPPSTSPSPLGQPPASSAVARSSPDTPKDPSKFAPTPTGDSLPRPSVLSNPSTSEGLTSRKPPRRPRFILSAHNPRAGGRFTVKLSLRDAGKFHFNGRSISCSANVSGRVIGLLGRPTGGGAARCVWRVPKAARGLLVKASIRVRYAGSVSQLALSRRVN